MEIRNMQKEDKDKIISMMCEAFIDDKLYKFFIEDEIERGNFLKKFMKFRLTFGIKKGKVCVSDDCKSVAIWILPNKEMTPIDLVLCGGLSAILSCKPNQRKRITDFNSFADEEKVKSLAQPFWHLSPICVSPKLQGQGYGKALIKHGLETIEASSQPCYIETQSKKNVSIYEKYGFKCLRSNKVPTTEITTYAMVYMNT